MAPVANDKHQRLVGRLTRIPDEVVTDDELGHVRPGVNISDRIDAWKQNFRIPDVAVFLNGSRAKNHDTFSYGGPDFAVEIASPGDRSRDKLDFYGTIGTRELLIIDRDPWQLELFRHDGTVLESVAAIQADSAGTLKSEVVGLTFVFLHEASRPRIQVSDSAVDRAWTI